MSTEKTSPPTPGAAGQTEFTVTDPADQYAEESRNDWAAYERALEAGELSAAHLNERNHELLGAWGNPRSKKGFDPAGFRDR